MTLDSNFAERSLGIRFITEQTLKQLQCRELCNLAKSLRCFRNVELTNYPKFFPFLSFGSKYDFLNALNEIFYTIVERVLPTRVFRIVIKFFLLVKNL